MELRKLLIDLIMGTVWIYSGIILSLVKNKSCKDVKPYRIAKKYMILFLVFSGLMTIIITSLEMLFGKELECLCIFTLFCNFVKAILLLLSVMSLFDHEGCSGRKLWRCFLPVFVLVILYFISRLIFVEPEVYSIMDFLRCMSLSPPISIRLLIEFSIITGVGMVVYNYLRHKKIYLSKIDELSLSHERECIRWIDKMLVVMILMGILTTLDSMVTWELYSYINRAVSTVGMVYCVITFIDYRLEPISIQAVKEDTDVNVAFLLLEEDKEENQIIDVAYETVGMKEEIIVAENVVAINDFDENYYYTKKAVDKWVGHPDKLYLKAGITLKDASLGAGISRRKLSDFIKCEYDCNFNTWINTLRIEEVKRILLEEDANLSLSYIADCAGFSDLAGMSNTFKKIIGIPPSLYRKEIVTKTIQEELMVED